jgi:hypothetical protein
MRLKKGQYIGPLKSWWLNQETFQMEEHDWSKTIVKSADAKAVPIAGALSLGDFTQLVDQTGSCIRDKVYGKIKWLLRAFPKLVILQATIPNDEFEIIRARLETKLIEAGIVVINGGFLLWEEPAPELEEGEDPPVTEVDFETDFSASRIPFSGDPDDDNYHDIHSTTTVSITRTYYDHEKWDGGEVLLIDGSTAFMNLFNSPGWGNESGGQPPRGFDSDIDGDVTKSEDSFQNVSAAYTIFDSNPIWTENNDDDGTYTVSSVEYEIYSVSEQIAADTDKFAEYYHPGIYERIGVRYIHTLVSVDTEYPEELDNVFAVAHGDANDDDLVWEETYDTLQAELLAQCSSNVQGVVASYGGEYFSIELTADGPTDVDALAAAQATNTERVEQIITWIKDFYDLEE